MCKFMGLSADTKERVLVLLDAIKVILLGIKVCRILERATEVGMRAQTQSAVFSQGLRIEIGTSDSIIRDLQFI